MEYYCDDVLNTDFCHTGQRNIKVSFIMVHMKTFCEFKNLQIYYSGAGDIGCGLNALSPLHVT